LDALHVEGVAVTLVIEHGVGETILQLVKPAPPVWLNEIYPAEPL
jgi:hypothetical protein